MQTCTCHFWQSSCHSVADTSIVHVQTAMLCVKKAVAFTHVPTTVCFIIVLRAENSRPRPHLQMQTTFELGRHNYTKCQSIAPLGHSTALHLEQRSPWQQQQQQMQFHCQLVQPQRLSLKLTLQSLVSSQLTCGGSERWRDAIVARNLDTDWYMAEPITLRR